MRLPGREKNYDIFSRLDTIHERDRQTDRQTDGRTDTGQPQRPRLRIASRGNNTILRNCARCMQFNTDPAHITFTR